jgi:hypothetical protein
MGIGKFLLEGGKLVGKATMAVGKKLMETGKEIQQKKAELVNESNERLWHLYKHGSFVERGAALQILKERGLLPSNEN